MQYIKMHGCPVITFYPYIVVMKTTYAIPTIIQRRAPEAKLAPRNRLEV